MNQNTRNVLENNYFAVLSTVSGAGIPWGTPVHMAFDEQNIYWVSADSSIHSQNIMSNGKVFIVVFDSQQNVARDQRAALYLETTARALEGEAAVAAHDVYAGRFPTSHFPGGEDHAHIYAAPIGILNEAKTKGGLMYYQPAEADGDEV